MKNSIKFSLLFLAFSMVSIGAWAQQRGSITGTLVDEQSSEPVPGVIVGYLLNGSEGEPNYVAESTPEGKFTISQLPYGDYSIILSFITYLEDTIAVKLDKATVNIGEVKMRADVKQVSTAIVQGVAPRASISGDTLTFNASAFKVNTDANAGELISKMQGMVVEDGRVTFMGNEVRQVRVDGREFFGDDVKAAIENIPADMIDGVSAYTQLSDAAEFTGIEDGNSFQALNFTTKDGVTRATFGQVRGSYGFDELYSVGANVTTLKNNRRLAVYGLSNNMNNMGSSFDDGDGRVFSMPGISKNHNLGGNYSNDWGKLDLSANYNFGKNSYSVTQRSERYEYLENSTDFRLSESLSNSERSGHNFGGNIRWQDENNQIRIRPSFSMNNSSGDQTNNNETTRTPIGMTEAEATRYTIERLSENSNAAYNGGLRINYTRKLGGRRTLSVNVSGNMNKSDGNSLSNSLQKWYGVGARPDSTTNQTQDNLSKSHSINAGIRYAEPITSKLRLTLNYDYRYQYSDRNQSAYLFDPHINEFNFSERLSNVSNSGYQTHEIGPGINYVNGGTSINAGIDYEYDHNNIEQTYPVPQSPLGSISFNNFVYEAQLRHRFGTASNLRFSVNSRVQNPSIQNLQDVLDVSNPESIRQGNPNLKSEYSNSFNGSFNTVVNTTHTFSVGLSGSLTSNYITNSEIKAASNGTVIYDDQGDEVITIDNAVRFSRPVNLNGAWNGRVNMTYGLPVKFIGSNVNFNVGYNHNETPGMFGESYATLRKYKTASNSYSIGAGIGSNISQFLDFRFRYNFSYSDSKSDNLANADNSNTNQTFSGNVKWITWGGITLTANAAYAVRNAITQNQKTESILVNASLGKKIFKGLGEINVGVNDLLNQKENFMYTASQYYTNSSWSNTLGRYVSINFIYNIRNYNGYTPPSNMQRGQRPERMDGGGGRPPMGMPMRGGPGGGGGRGYGG